MLNGLEQRSNSGQGKKAPGFINVCVSGSIQTAANPMTFLITTNGCCMNTKCDLGGREAPDVPLCLSTTP
jgi:hypothetical protein